MGAPLDLEEYERWSAHARSAREAADLLGKEGRPEWACFLYEQAAQMVVKALLKAIGVDAWGHDLTDLCGRLAPEHPAFAEEPVLQAAARLSRHYIATRYPDAHASGPPGVHYTPDDVLHAREDADLVDEAVARSWRALREDAP